MDAFCLNYGALDALTRTGFCNCCRQYTVSIVTCDASILQARKKTAFAVAFWNLEALPKLARCCLDVAVVAGLSVDLD